MSGKPTTFYLPQEIVSLIDQVGKDRFETTRSETLRFLVLKALAELDYLTPETKKAYGLLSNEGE